MRVFDWVWVSTDEQLAAMKEWSVRTSLVAKLSGAYRLPEHAARVHILFFPWMRIPLVYLSEGALIVSEQGIQFTYQPRRIFLGCRAEGLRSDLTLELHPSELFAVEPGDFASPYSPDFDIPFTRIRSTRGAPFDNLLVGIGRRHTDPITKMRDQCLELRQSLLDIAAK